MGYNPNIQSTYDGKPLRFISYMPVVYRNKRQDRFCPQCVEDNLTMCCDKGNKLWYITSTQTEPDCGFCCRGCGRFYKNGKVTGD